MIIDDKITFGNVESSTIFDNYTLVDIDRIEYITAGELQATNDFILQTLCRTDRNGVIFIYTKQFINSNSNPVVLESGTAGRMGYPNLVKRAYTKP